MVGAALHAVLDIVLGAMLNAVLDIVLNAVLGAVAGDEWLVLWLVMSA